MTEEWETYRYHQARVWLEHIRGLGEKVASTQAMIEAERDLMDGVRAIDPTKEGGSSRADDAMVDIIERMERHVREFLVLVSEYEDERMDARKRLAKLPEATERAALTYRYLLGWSWELICVEMNYTHDGMMKLRRRAIVNAYDVMPLEKREPIYHAI